ncbi:MAG: hypothetical protein QNL01_00775 [Akkermansiaceae bacterium]
MPTPPVTATAPTAPKTTTTEPKSKPASSESTPTAPSKGLTFIASFATPGISPFDDIEWSTRTAAITDDSGGVMFRQGSHQALQHRCLRAPSHP